MSRARDRGVVSFPKCGRTWIRLFLEYYKRLGGQNIRVVFRHNNEYGFKKRVLLIRHPCDVMVSFWMYRKARRQAPMPFRELVDSERFGLPRFNRWYSIWSVRKRNQLVMRYEDLFKVEAWVDFLTFFDTPIVPGALDGAFKATKFDSVRANLDEIATFPSAWRYLAAEGGTYSLTDPVDPDAHKFRRGKVGGYVDYLDEDEIDCVMNNFTLGENLELYRQQYLSESL